jgi:heterodisulfide reductase subunit A
VVRAKTDYGVEYINSDGTVQEETENHDPIVSYDVAGRPERRAFDMVVLATTLVPRPGTAELAKVLGLTLDEFGFIKSKDRILAPVETNVPGIFIAGYCAGPADIPESVAQGSAAAAKAAEVLLESRVFA